tara:strand:+ start:545 stop:826 length:282 start_codon:yes stop_codon:yes gene_type:complete
MKIPDKLICNIATPGVLSITGMYNWWYPNPDNKVEIKSGSTIEYLSTWRHQDKYLAFKVPVESINREFAPLEKNICVWIKRELIEWIIRNQEE